MSDFVGSTSVVSWSKKRAHLRIYSSDGSKVTEKTWDGQWKNGDFSQDGQAVSAIAWLDDNHQIHIRVYVSNLGEVTEYCWDKDCWYSGDFPRTAGVAISATSWTDDILHIRVYVTQSDGQTTELCWDDCGPWYTGEYPN